MRHYEIVFLVHPDQSEQVPAMIDRYKDLVSAGSGFTHRVEDWGRRRLAYMINDVHKAHYAMLNIECGLDVLAEIKRNFKFNDSILRHLIIKRKGAEIEESPLAKVKEDAAEEASKFARETESKDSKPDKADNTEVSTEAAQESITDADVVAEATDTLKLEVSSSDKQEK